MGKTSCQKGVPFTDGIEAKANDTQTAAA